ncbi:MAG: fasciclin domain-containing protein [Chitinophagaceae bacterium]
MKKSKINFTRLRFVIALLVGSSITIACIQGCKKDPFSYQEQTRQVLAYDMLKKDTSISIAISALDKAKLSPTLNTYGPFTFFVPNNNAFRKFFVSKGKNSLSDFSDGEIRTIMVYHILTARLRSSEFRQGPQTNAPTGAGDVLSLDISKGYKYNTVANSIANVYETDIEYSNALVHKIDAVLNPPTQSIGQFLEQNTNKYSIMIAGLKRANLWDTINNLADAAGTRIRITLLAESNETLIAAGISSFATMPLDELDILMRYHMIAGASFSADYTKKTDPNPRAGLNTERWDSTILSLNGQQYLYFDLAADKLINGIANFDASDVIMRNGVLHVLDKHIEFNPGIKRTPIFWYFAGSPNSHFAYGVPGISSNQPPAIRGSGRWRTFGPEGTPARDFIFFDPDGLNDSMIAVVPNVRKGKYSINISYKAGGRGDYQLKYGEDLIGVPKNMGLSIMNGTNGNGTYDQRSVIGTYDFMTSSTKRLNFVCTRVSGFAPDFMVLTPVY